MRTLALSLTPHQPKSKLLGRYEVSNSSSDDTNIAADITNRSYGTCGSRPTSSSVLQPSVILCICCACLALDRSSSSQGEPSKKHVRVRGANVITAPLPHGLRYLPSVTAPKDSSIRYPPKVIDPLGPCSEEHETIGPRESLIANLLDVPTNAAGCPTFPPDARSRKNVHQRYQ